MSRIALCADGASLQHPEMLGLQEEILESQSWLTLHNSAQQAREELEAANDIHEIWVVSSDDMAAINLAAALKKDHPFRQVLLFAHDCSGSVKSRASHAGLDGVVGAAEFPKMYLKRKLAEQGVEAGDDHASSEKDAVCVELASPTTRGFVLPVVSGSGGVGKSAVSTLLALAARKRGLNTLLIDLDLQFGDVKELLSLDQSVSVDEAIATPEVLSRVSTSTESLAVLSAPMRVEQAEALLPHLTELIELQRAAYDLIVINTGCFWTEQHILLLEHCDKALFLMDQRPSALRSCKKALDLCTRCGVAGSPFVIGVNRCAKNALFTSIDASCALHGIPAVELREGGSEVEALLAAGCAVELAESGNPFIESIERVLLELVPAAKDAIVQEKDPSPRPSWFTFGKRRRRDS